MLKENIEHKEGMPVDQFKLIYMGQQMDEMKKLMDYKISAGSSIIMVPSLRGGQQWSYTYWSLNQLSRLFLSFNFLREICASF